MAFGVQRGKVSSRIGAGLALMTLVFIAAGAGTSAAPAQAEDCPNEQLRGREGAALQLPDCRAYEQVSPVTKNFTDALGEAEVVQSSPSGGRVTFFSDAPFPGVLSATGPSLYLGTRAGGEWSTQGLVPQTAIRSSPQRGAASVLSLSEDLSAAVVNTEPGLDANLPPGRYSYLRDNANGTFQLLGPGIATFADATADDSRIIFESSERLLPEAANAVNLYEWDNSKPPGKQLSLAGLLPEGEAPTGGSVAGPGGPALGGRAGGATGRFYTQNTISADGSRIFFTDASSGRIYMREPGAARTIPVSAGTRPALWQAATTDGSVVFYTEGEDLYRFDADNDAREALTSGAAGVLGTLGISTEDGSYVYFVATGVLAGNENANKETAEEEVGNLYEWHDGETTFIARLSTEGFDPYDWRELYSASPGAPAHGGKSSRVTPDGTAVLFASQARLTGYANAEFDELYLYGTVSGELACVSCNPSGAPATNAPFLTGNQLSLGGEPRNAFLTRNLSDDGDRVFFQTKEALLPQDANEQTDVYEWEREGTGGAGGCSRSSASFSEGSGGCLYLISTGQSDDQSYFGDASADGGDVFFFTRQPLVGRDQDENDDLYDAHVEGGITAQNPLSSVSCTGEGCLGPVGSSPVFDEPSSTTSTGAEDPTPKPGAKPKLTRAQKLAKALRACRKQPRRKRGACAARARKRYGKRAGR
jgi:hypothetical protein